MKCFIEANVCIIVLLNLSTPFGKYASTSTKHLITQSNCFNSFYDTNLFPGFVFTRFGQESGIVYKGSTLLT